MMEIENETTSVISDFYSHIEAVEGIPVEQPINNLDDTLRPIGLSITIVLFIVGLIAMFNKKLSKKAKIIICLSIAFLIILIFLLPIIIYNIH